MQLLEHHLARPGESLTQHTLQVVRHLRELETLRKMPPVPLLRTSLTLAAWLHDSGKLAQGFQRQLSQKNARWGLRHEVLSLAFVPWLDCSAELRLRICLLIATHHRGLDFILDTYRAGTGRVETLLADVDEVLISQWYEWLRGQGVPLLAYRLPTTADLYQQLEMLANWQIAQPEPLRASPDYPELLLAHGFFTHADHIAAAGHALYPLEKPRLESMIGMNRLYAHQHACAANAGKSVILTAPAGAGKTLASLLWARDTAGQLIYLLPYRASMNAMHRQLQTAYTHVGIQHGRALHVLYREARQQVNESLAQMQARVKLDLARLHAYPARVTSPHVLLRAMYSLSGHTATQAMLYGAAMVVDEIHAYQPERLAKILSMLAFFQQKLDVRLLLMTATLPGVMRVALTEVLGSLQQIEADEAVYRHFRRHRIQLESGDVLDRLPEIVADARAGAGVLICVNTVRRARSIARIIAQEYQTDVLLLHGRFNGKDRWEQEQQLLALFGMGSNRTRNPIVVSTQVIEVSLNLDFDVLHSDPAPLDALLQRFGRVNRNGRLTEPAPVHVYTQPDGTAARFSIYDVEITLRTLALLQEHNGEVVDEAATTAWLDAVYHDHEAWLARFRQARTDFEVAVLDQLHPFEPAGEWMRRAYGRLFDELYVLPLNLEDAYKLLVKRNSVEANDLLVPISWGQYKMLEGHRQAWQEEERYVVDCRYDARLGLLLDQDEEE